MFFNVGKTFSAQKLIKEKNILTVLHFNFEHLYIRSFLVVVVGALWTTFIGDPRVVLDINGR